MKNYNDITVLLVDGGDRQTLPLARAFHKLGCKVATLNSSRLDIGYTTRFVDIKLLDKKIHDSKLLHEKAIRKAIESRNFNLIVSTSDDTAEMISLMRKEYDHFVKFSVVDPDLFYQAYDKNKTMKICMENNIPCPKTYFGYKSMDDIPFNELAYPLVVKPRKSFGAIGYHKVNCESELRKICYLINEEIENYVFQEYIPQTDIQYECAMFIDDNNEVKTACVFSKNRWFPVNGGSSTCNVTVERNDIIASCSKLLKIIKWRGAADIDLIQDPRDGKAKIMEINPRVSGSVKIVFSSGINIAEQIIQLATDKPVSNYLEYKKDVRLRCIHTDLLWFIKSSQRFNTKPSWFSWKNTRDQIWSVDDPLPFFTFSIQAVLKYKREMKKRGG